MYITVGRKDIVIGPRARWAASTAVALFVHLLAVWGILSSWPKPYDMTDLDTTPPEDVLIYEVPKPPEPQPKVIVQPRPQVTPREVQAPQAEPKPEQAAAPPPSVVPQPQPPTPAPQVAIKTQTVPQVDIQQNQSRQFTQDKLADATSDVPEIARPHTTTKKKKDEDAGLQKPAADAGALSDLNLHQAANAPPALAAGVEPSGLSAPGAAAGGKGAPAGAGALAGLNGAQGVVGKGMNGRGSLTQAMQNHDFCNTAVAKGKSPPPNCDMAALSGQANLGLKNRPDLKAAAAAVDANRAYKTGAGNSDYWNRVGGSPSTGVQPNFRPEDHDPGPGAYSKPDDQDVMGGHANPKTGG